MKHQRMDISHTADYRSCQKKQEVADAMKQMRRGAKPKKPPRFKSPKIPNYSEIFKAKKNNQA